MRRVHGRQHHEAEHEEQADHRLPGLDEDRVDLVRRLGAKDSLGHRRHQRDRVELEGEVVAEGAGEAIGLSAPAWWIIAAAVAAFFIGLILLGILFLGLAPQTVENLREDAERHLFRSFGFGLLGLATLLGLLPLAVVTLVGLPLIPVILLTIGFLAVFAYLLGSYVLAHRVFRSFGAAHATMAGRLRTFVVGLVVLLALNAVPLIGWLINAFAALVGFGALEMRLVRLLSRSSQRPPREAEPAAPSA